MVDEGRDCGQGIVQESRGHRARIWVERSAACAGCAASGVCNSGQEKGMEVLAFTQEHLAPGDRVQVEIAEGAGLRLTWWTYGAPTLALVAGALAGFLGAGTLGGDQDLWAALGGILTSVIILLLCLRWQNRSKKILITARKIYSREG